MRRKMPRASIRVSSPTVTSRFDGSTIDLNNLAARNFSEFGFSRGTTLNWEVPETFVFGIGLRLTGDS